MQFHFITIPNPIHTQRGSHAHNHIHIRANAYRREQKHVRMYVDCTKTLAAAATIWLAYTATTHNPLPLSPHWLHDRLLDVPLPLRCRVYVEKSSTLLKLASSAYRQIGSA